MDREEVRLHGLLDQVVHLHVFPAAALEGAASLPRRGNGVRPQRADIRLREALRSARLHRGEASAEVGKRHGEALPGIVVPDDIRLTDIDRHPVLCHLVNRPVFGKLLRRIDGDHVAALSADFKFEHAGHILAEIIDQPAGRIRSQELSLVGLNHPDGRYGLLRLPSLREVFFGNQLRVLPHAVVKAGVRPALDAPPPVCGFGPEDVRVQDHVRSRLKGGIACDPLFFPIGVYQVQAQVCHEDPGERPVGVGIGRHERREVKAVVLLIHDKPTVSDFHAKDVLALPQEAGEVKGHEAHALPIVGPCRVQHVVADLLPVQEEVELAQSADADQGLFG